MMICRYCGSDIVEYIGAVDGAGDYGEAVCDEWQCHNCGVIFDGDCIGQAVDGNFEDDDIRHDERSEEFLTKLFGDEFSHLDVGDIPF